MSNIQYEIKNAQPLVGGVITGILDGGESFGLQVRACLPGGGKRTLHVWVDRDPEGNGPGHLNIEDQSQR